MLHQDFALEVAARAEAQVFVRRPRVAVGAAVEATPVRIDAEAEPEIRAVVLGEDALALVLVEVEGSVGLGHLVVLDPEALEAISGVVDGQAAHGACELILNG
jgi:hypothetical protein